MPIGVPFEQLSNDTVDYLQEPGRAVRFGLGGGAVHLTSWSVPYADLIKKVTHPSAVIADPDDLFTFGPAPGRPGSQIAFWSGGRASVMPTNESDNEVLRAISGSFRGGTLILDVSANGYLLPCDRTMRGTDRFGPSFRAGAAQITVSDLRSKETVDVHWPSGWTALTAAAQSRGLMAKPSEPGMAALALLRSLGGLDGVRWLLHEPLIDLFYRLAERSGMSWWKKRWTLAEHELRRLGVDEAAIKDVAEREGRDEPAVAPAGEGRDESFDAFRVALGGKRDAAANWVSWAERQHLLVRGAAVECPQCGVRTWLPIASLPPPGGCAGCGREIAHPYGVDFLKFRYRLGEPLRRVLETDSLGHLFTLHWAVRLFGQPGVLVGAHPGVTFADHASGKDIGEADVLLLFHDGHMVPIEVKRRTAGVDERAVALMEILTEALRPPWDAMAVGQAASDCASVADIRRHIPLRPRYLLTHRQLLDPAPFWSIGNDPFQWDPNDAEDTSERQEKFVNSVRAGDIDMPHDFVHDALVGSIPD